MGFDFPDLGGAEEIFSIPFNDKGDYGRPVYSAAARLSDQDRARIEKKISEILNSTEMAGEEAVDTSSGSIRIIYKPHKTLGRRKEVAGFRVSPELTKNLDVSEVFKIIRTCIQELGGEAHDNRQVRRLLTVLEEELRGMEEVDRTHVLVVLVYASVVLCRLTAKSDKARIERVSSIAKIILSYCSAGEVDLVSGEWDKSMSS